MVKYSRLEIYFNILEVIENGVTKPVQIMHNINVSYAILQDILKSLKKSGFIVEEIKNSAKRYQITEEGINALSYYLKSLNSSVESKDIFVK